MATICSTKNRLRFIQQDPPTSDFAETRSQTGLTFGVPINANPKNLVVYTNELTRPVLISPRSIPAGNNVVEKALQRFNLPGVVVRIVVLWWIYQLKMAEIIFSTN
jgi:hypothetical protein